MRDAIESRIDHKALRRVLVREKRVRKELIKKLEAQREPLPRRGKGKISNWDPLFGGAVGRGTKEFFSKT